MAIEFVNTGIAVEDLDEAIAFFTALGLEVAGRDTIQGEWADTAVGLDGNHADIAVLRTPGGDGEIELFQYRHPNVIPMPPTEPHHIGMHRLAFRVDDLDAALRTAAEHGSTPLRGVGNYQDVYRLAYLRGPSGIIVMLAEDLRR